MRADRIWRAKHDGKNNQSKFVDFHKQLMQHNIDDVMSYKDFLKMFATDEETIAKINALADGVMVIALFMAISIWKM